MKSEQKWTSRNCMRGLGALLALVLAIPDAYGATYPYMDDAEPVLEAHLFPKVAKTEGYLTKAASAYAKYDLISYNPGDPAVKAREVRQLNPSTRLLCFVSGRAYQGEVRTMPFLSTGPRTDTQGMMFAGHWMYRAGTRLTANVTATTTTLQVGSTAGFRVNEYIVIYDNESLPATKFLNAEHCQITSVGAGTLEVTRGYKSNAVAHNSQSIVAEHAIGMVPDSSTHIWSYNHASTAPVDADGKTIGQRNAEWIEANRNVDKNGNVISGLEPDGLHLDADTYSPGEDVDANNDLVADGGIINGENVWINGYHLFYQNLRAIPVFANKSIVGGVAETLGFGANELSGTQVEDFPYYFIKDPSANDFEKNFNIYLTHTYYHTAPAPSTNCLAKHGSPLYTSELTQLGWKEFRLTLGLALMADGFFSHFTEDPWYEEFSVNPVTGVADPLAASQPQNRHWMGQPLGKFRRIYTETAFEPADAVLTQLGKTASLNGDYTLCFTASMPKPKRVVQFGLGDRTRSTLIPTKPKRFVYTFYGQTGTKDIRIDTSEGVTVSDIYLFKGTANLLRRDFEKAVVFANMGKQSVTVAPAPGERWMRIKGNGGNLDPTNDGTVYDGNQSNSFVLPAEDAAILVKLSGSLPPPQAPRGLRVE